MPNACCAACSQSLHRITSFIGMASRRSIKNINMFYYIFTSKSPKSEHRSCMENHRLNLWTESALNAIIVQMSRQKMLVHTIHLHFKFKCRNCIAHKHTISALSVGLIRTYMLLYIGFLNLIYSFTTKKFIARLGNAHGVLCFVSLSL